MSLQSQLFKGDKALEACAVQDSAHIQLGAVGQHVGKIQTALSVLDRLDIDAGELAAATGMARRPPPPLCRLRRSEASSTAATKRRSTTSLAR